MLDAVAVLARGLSFIALFQAAGGALYLLLYGRALGLSRMDIVRVQRLACIAALLLVLLHFSLQVAGMTGEMSGIGDPKSWQLALRGGSGLGLRLRMSGLLLVLAGSGAAVRHGRDSAARQILSALIGALGIMMVLWAFTTLGHTVDHRPHRVLATLLFVHLLCITFWFGALWPLRQLITLEPPAQAARQLERFSDLAVWVAPGLFVVGGALLLLLVPGVEVLRQPYGQLLLAKIAGFCLLMGLAAHNKLRLTAALAREEVTAGSRLRRSLLAEYLIIAGVLTVTAVMTGLYAPD